MIAAPSTDRRRRNLRNLKTARVVQAFNSGECIDDLAIRHGVFIEDIERRIRGWINKQRWVST